MPSPLIIPALFLLMLANGAPWLVPKLLGDRFAYPVDGHCAFVDRRPLFGPSKTWRGIAAAILVTTAGAALIGLGWRIGLVVGGFAMVGDLTSSFLKRRLGRMSSAPVVGIDQIPESLFPLLACRGPLGLSYVDVAIGVAIFFFGELLLSRVLYAFDLRDRPY